MKRISFILLPVLFIILWSCSKDDSPDESGSTIAQEINPAKNFYTANGCTFKSRLYNYPPTEGDNNNNNNHTAEINKIIEDNGMITIISKYTVPAISLQSYGAVLNVKGDIVSPQSATAIGIQNASYNDDFEILDGTRLVSYNYSGGSRGGYGFTGARIYVHNPVFFSGAISDASNQGYMHTLNNSNFMLSMGYNSNYGHPMFYQYMPTTYTWTGYIVTEMDYENGSGINIPTTNDASKVGNTNKVFWAWLSYTTTPDNGSINIISFDGSTYSFSDKTSLSGIGSVVEGLSLSHQHTIQLYKNPDNLNNPYMVVRRYNSDILDIYKFTGTAIEVVKTGVTLPTSIPIISGTIRLYKEIAFSGSNVYLITGMDKSLYKLSESTFVIDKPDLTLTDETISALESTSGGVLISIVKTILASPQPKTVSDIVLIPN
jgi:hypothetical protein